MSNKTSYKHCLNCQTELQGVYCHVCGQHVTNAKPTVKEFILEYLNIAFIWDKHFLKTMCQLLRKPGRLTNDYVSGKFVAYTHPLKLNMFLLFVFITLFLIFHKDFGDSIKNITRDEANYPLIQIEVLNRNKEYAPILESGPSDTIQLYSPLQLADQFPDIISAVDVPASISRDSLLVWTAVVPRILIEKKVITLSEDGYYYFSRDTQTGVVGMDLLETIWSQMVKLITTYFPIFILLTVPFLAFMLSVTHRKVGYSNFKHLILSLHYTAFLETFIILIYILNLIVSPPMWAMQWMLILGASVYLTLAIREVYQTKNWFKAAGQAVFTNFGYVVTLLAVFFIIFIISVVLVVVRM